MTLIVGRITQDIGFLVADTLLSSEFELKGQSGPINGKYHALKVQILNPYTAVGFAGDVELSLRLIADVHSELSQDPSIDVSQRLFDAYRQTVKDMSKQEALDCSFLVLKIGDGGRKLALVTKEELRNREFAYIGDANEYKNMRRLQRRYVPPAMQSVQQPDGTFCEMPLIVSRGEIEFSEISDAMEELCQQRSNGKHNKSVGAISGLITRVVDARISGELEYLQYHTAWLTPWEGNGGFSLVAANAGKRGIGMYFQSGKMGFLFIVGDSQYCRKEYAETLNEFVVLSRAKYDLSLI